MELTRAKTPQRKETLQSSNDKISLVQMQFKIYYSDSDTSYKFQKNPLGSPNMSRTHKLPFLHQSDTTTELQQAHGS